MKEIDESQEWFRSIPGYRLDAVVRIETEAIAARESGLLFYTLVLAVSDSPVDISTNLTIVAQTGWELMPVTHQPTPATVRFLFKKA